MISANSIHRSLLVGFQEFPRSLLADRAYERGLGYLITSRKNVGIMEVTL